MVLISREQHFRKLIQILDSGYFIPIQLDFGTRYFFHPDFFDGNKAMEG